MGGVNGVARFPFRYFNDSAIAGAHHCRNALSYEAFFTQGGDALPHKLQKFTFFSRLWAVSYDYANAWHDWASLPECGRASRQKRPGQQSIALRSKCPQTL